MSDFLGIVQAFQLAIKATLMYTTNHPRTQAALTTLSEQLDRWLASTPNLHIAAYESKIFLDGAPFEGTHVHLAALARQFNDRKIAGFIFQRGVTLEELEGVIELLILKPAKIEEAGGPGAFIEKKNMAHVRLSQTQYKEVRDGEGGDNDHGGPGSVQSEGFPENQVHVEANLAATLAMLADEARNRLSGEYQRPAPPANAGQGSGAGQGPGQGMGKGSGLGEGMGPGQGFAEGGGQGAGQGYGTGAEGSGQGFGTGSGKDFGNLTGMADAAFDLQILTDQWEEQLDLLPEQSLLAEGGLEAANLGYLGGTPLAFGMGDGFPPAHQIQGLRNALLEQTPEQMLAVIAGLDTLPSEPAGMRMAFQALSAEAFSKASTDLMASETPWEAVKEAIFNTLRYNPQQQSMLAALEMEMRNRGLGLESQERFRELLEQLNWESLSLEEQISLALNHSQFWALTLEQRLIFLRRLLDDGRMEPFLAVMEEVLERMAGDHPGQREQAAGTVKGVSPWMLDPGLPVDLEGPMIQGLVATFGWEPHMHIHLIVTAALDNILEAIITKDDPGQALALLQEMTGLCQFQQTTTPWRQAALSGLYRRLADPVALRKVVELLHTATPEAMLNEIIPFLEAGGGASCRILVQVLGEEPDRKRRGRLIEAIRGLGEPALPALYEGLNSPTWYLVRNTLNLLADLGDAAALPEVERCLAHADGRVKRAAVRCLWKVCGPVAVPTLLAALKTSDPETQMEIIFALGQLRSRQALPALAAFALAKHAPEPLRIRAAETLGQIGDPEALGALKELAQRKGRIFTSAEPTAVRLAACRGLLALATAEALTALTFVVTAEPRNKDRALMQQILDQRTPA